jgi:hypothetical protein
MSASEIRNLPSDTANTAPGASQVLNPSYGR